MSPDGDAMTLAKPAESVKRAAVRKALAAEHGNPDYDKDDDGDPSKDKMGESKKEKAQFNAWNKLAVITRLSCHGLERHIYSWFSGNRRLGGLEVLRSSEELYCD